MTALWGHDCDRRGGAFELLMLLGIEAGMMEGVRGDEVVGATLMISFISVLTLFGWTLWMSVKAGRSKIVVGSE